MSGNQSRATLVEGESSHHCASPSSPWCSVNISLPSITHHPKGFANRLSFGRIDTVPSNSSRIVNVLHTFSFTLHPKCPPNWLCLGSNLHSCLESSWIVTYYSPSKVSCKSTRPGVESTQLSRIERNRQHLTYSPSKVSYELTLLWVESTYLPRIESTHQHLHTPLTASPKCLTNRLCLGSNRHTYLESSQLQFNRFESNRQYFIASYNSQSFFFFFFCKLTWLSVELTQFPGKKKKDKTELLA